MSFNRYNVICKAFQQAEYDFDKLAKDLDPTGDQHIVSGGRMWLDQCVRDFFRSELIPSKEKAHKSCLVDCCIAIRHIQVANKHLRKV